MMTITDDYLKCHLNGLKWSAIYSHAVNWLTVHYIYKRKSSLEPIGSSSVTYVA